MKLILASNSPRRKELLSLITENFEVVPSKGGETLDDSQPYYKLAADLAKQKSEEISALYPDCAVVGADTLVYCGGMILGKPKDRREAEKMLGMLSGKSHTVITAVSIARAGKAEIQFSEQTRVEFYPLTDREITEYVDSGEPMDKAGAYGIQGKGSLLVKGINGDFYTVMGLPVARLYRELKGFGLEL